MPPVNAPAQRGNGVNPAGDTFKSQGGFDMASFQRSLDEQQNLVKNRQIEQAAAARETQRIAGQSSQLAKQQSDSVGFLLKNVQAAREKATHARELADSSNPMDRLELMGLQITDPSGYLRKNREARLQEDSQQAAVLNQYFGIQQDSLRTQLIASTANVDYLKQLEAIGQEKLTAYSTQAKLMGDQLAANQTMKEVAIHGLDDKSLDAAIAQAKQAENGVVNIGGIDVDSRTLEARKGDLNERAYNQQVLELNRKLAEDKLAHVDDTLADAEYDRQVNRNKRDNMQTDLAIENAKRRNEADALMQTAKKKILATQSLGELADIRANGYKSSTGEQYIPDDVEQAYQTKKAGETEAINQQIRENTLKNFDTGTMSQELEWANSVETRVPANTPLAAAMKQYKSSLGIAALGVGPQNGDITRITAIEGYTKAKETFEKAIEQQVIKESKGDKNTADLLRAFYRGDPTPQDSLQDAAFQKLTKNLSVAGLFPAPVAKVIESKYQEFLSQNTARGLADPALTPSDREQAKVNAVRQAIEFGVNESLQMKTEQVVGGQVEMPGHPFYGKVSPTDFTLLVDSADYKALQGAMQANNLDMDKVKQLKAGNKVEGAPDPKAFEDELIQRQNQELLSAVDARFGTGAGHELADWWMTHGRDYIGKVQASTGAQANDFGTYNLKSASDEVTQAGFSKYAFGLGQADDLYRDKIVNDTANMLNFGNDPTNVQVTALSMNKHMSDDEKSQIYTQVIKPLLDSAKSKGLSFDDTNRYVEQQVMNYQAQTPEMKGLLKTLRRDRAEDIESINTFGQLLKTLIVAQTAPFNSTVRTAERQVNYSPKLEWFRKLEPNRQQPRPFVKIGRPDFSGVFNR